MLQRQFNIMIQFCVILHTMLQIDTMVNLYLGMLQS